MATRRFKLRLSKVIPSFRFCLSRNPSSTISNCHVSLTYLLSPYNQKSLDLSFPNPPPSTPVTSSTTRLISTVTSSFSCKHYYSSAGSDDGDVSSTSPLVARKRVVKKKKGLRTVDKTQTRVSSSSGDSGWFSSGEVGSSAKSVKRPRSKGKTEAKTTSLKTGVLESVAVEKRSEDPYGDFKRSMMEMILEKQMFETGELEELLRCYLTLNPRCHHKVIVGAFTEIWEVMFAKSAAVKRRSEGGGVVGKRLTWK